MPPLLRFVWGGEEVNFLSSDSNLFELICTPTNIEMLNFIQIVDLMIENFVVAGAEAVPCGSVAEPPLF